MIHLGSVLPHGNPRKFNPKEDYRDLINLETVHELVELASREPVYQLTS
jgi:hypothetical protein